MRKLMAGVCCAAAFITVIAAAEYKAMAFTGVGPLAYTNTQENSSWSLEGVMFRFGLDNPAGTLQIIQGGR